MKAKVIAIAVVLVLAGAGVGGYLYYDTVLRYTDDFTDCPVLAFRAAASSADAAFEFATEENLVDLARTERCSLDCRNGNHMACVLYGLAQHKGIYILEDVEAAADTLKEACGHGEALACDLETRVKEMAEEKIRAEAVAEARKKYAAVLVDLEKRKAEVGDVIARALAYNNGSKRPMTTSAMLGWYEGTVKYLLFDTPLLSQMHQVPGSKIEKSGLKDFVLAKYMGGSNKPDIDKINEFFEKFMRLGVQQIRLDYRVEKKKESDIPKRSSYFKAKHTFLYNAGQVELEVLEMIEKDINYEIDNS